jgi:DNA-binding transcriptional regulator YhcF (GntR family)
MEYNKHQAIYLQIAEFVANNILAGNWPKGEKIASVREMAGSMQVNPNTIMRTYTHLSDEGILFNKRGIGFFVAEDAPSRILKMQKEKFIKETLPSVFAKMDLLGIGFKDLKVIYEKRLK